MGLNDKKLIQQLLLFLVGIVKSLFARVTPPNKQANLTKWEQLFAAYRIADLVVAVAGNQFYSTGRYGWPFPVNLQAVWLANKFKKTFLFNAAVYRPFAERLGTGIDQTCLWKCAVNPCKG